MAVGKKTGGREKGTPNRRTQEIAAQLAELGCDPIEGMALLAMDKKNTPELRGRMFAELAAYVWPKRKAVEVSAGDGDGGGDFTLEELLKTYRGVQLKYGSDHL